MGWKRRPWFLHRICDGCYTLSPNEDGYEDCYQVFVVAAAAAVVLPVLVASSASLESTDDHSLLDIRPIAKTILVRAANENHASSVYTT
jgi:predicted transcriptional regulator of viral defense system